MRSSPCDTSIRYTSDAVSSALETNTYFGVSSETIATGEILTATIAYESAS